ncbi:MAG: diguanylate cyclase [Deltaproteobacteria bacterium]|nr:diguanylate cyclase [Deltaproteobacteria bacterium]
MKILIVEDEPVSRRLLEAFLRKWGYEVTVTDEGEKALEVLQGPDAPNLVISDWMMPGMDGLELCRRARGMDRPGYVYFIILTAKGGKENVVKGLDAGADDYLVKPFDQAELECRVRIGRRILDLESRILHLASTDGLTGLLNRRAFMERMEEEMHRARRQKTGLSVILADIDYFKKINDAYGHQAGDVVLQKFAEQIEGSSRPYDPVGRYGGEEFVICLPGADLSQAASVAERMRRGVEEMINVAPDLSTAILITGSFGVATLEQGSGEDVDSLIRRADDGLYRAKAEGRNRVFVAGD